MTAEDDDLDPSDWLAAQFGEEPPKPAVTPPVAPSPAPAPAAPAAPVAPAYQAPPAAPPVYQPPAAEPPSYQPPVATPPVYQQPYVVPPAAEPAQSWQLSAEPPAQPEPAAGGFSWGLTPGAEPLPDVPATPPAPLAAPSVPPAADPYVPPAVTAPPAPGALPFGEQPPAAFPPLGEQPPVALPPFGEHPTVAFPAFGGQPTEAFPAFGGQPTVAFPAPGGYPGQSVEPVPVDPSRWLAAPLDPALDGVTEVLEAELVGLTGPQGEGVGASALDDLFGETQFREFTDEPLIGPLPPRQSGGSGGSGRSPKAPREARAPIPRTQKILMIVAGALVAALALVALFALGMKVGSLKPSAAATPTPTPTASKGPVVLPVGPVKPGDYHWDQLLGGECVKNFESAWQDNYTVVDCASPHPAQLVFRGLFTDPASATYPGIDELQKRINLLCTPATIINYAVAGTVQDIQVQASYAANEKEWDAGNHSYFCFVNRSGGADLTASVAIQQVPVTPTATPAPTGTPTPGAPVTRGHAKGVKP
ncbi:MAG: large membrane associated protein [Pseudolysinimonas sp.]